MARKKQQQQEKPKNILITGATSSTGKALIFRLKEDPRVGKIVAVAKHGVPHFFSDFPPERFLFRECNILRSRDLKNLFSSEEFRKIGIDTVVHLAFHNRVEHGENVHELNVSGTKGLIEMCIHSGGISRFIFKSSDVVYKLTHKNPIYLDENADLNFDTDADQWIKDRVDADMICRSYMDCDMPKIVILRFSNIIGRNVHGQFNSFFDSRPILTTMGFDPTVNLIDMRDVTQALSLAIFKDVHGIYNIAGLDSAPIETIAELSGSTCIGIPQPILAPLNWLQRKLGLTDYYYSVDRERQKYTALLDISKARRELGYVPKERIEFK